MRGTPRPSCPLALLLLPLYACHRQEEAEPPVGWSGVGVTLDPLCIRYGHALIPEGGIAFGVVGAYDPSANHDPWNLYAEGLSDALPPFSWATATSARWDGDALALTLSNGERARLTRDPDALGLALRLTWEQSDGVEPEAGDRAAPLVRVQIQTTDTEPLYGLGETFDTVNHRGTARPMQIELDLDLESSYNETHVPVPFILGASGWGLGMKSDWPAAIDAASEDPERVTAVVNAPEGLDWVLLSDDDPVEVAAQWARSTALPRRPPDWALAPMLWRNVNESGDQVLEDAAAIRDGDFAFGVMWIDNPWQTSYNSMQPDPEKFPDWQGMVDTLHGLGFRWLAWTTPYLEETDPDFDAYMDDDLFVDLAIPLNDFGELVDLTSEEAQTRWQARVAAAADLGIQGWKLDYGEDIQVGYGAARLRADFANGADERTMHHRFVESYHGAYGAPYADGDRFLLGRAGAWGSAAITDCIWPGDLDSGFQAHGEDGHVGGLPAAIRGGVSLSMSGFPCFASDTGGYRHDRADQETIIRWTEFSALLPVMQVGGGSDHNYWLLEGDWTEAVPEAGRTYTQLHTRLFPYFQALLISASTEGTPPLVPAALLGADANADHADSTFAVGPSLLVAAVDEPGVTTWDVSFPPGTWVDWWTGEAYSGDQTVPAPLGQGPLFLGEGAIVPMLRDTARTIAPSSAGVESWSDDPGVLTVRFAPGEGELKVDQGPALVGTATSLTLGDPGLYTGLRVEIWAPDASAILLDGEAVPTTQSGPWLLAEVGEGTVTWE